MEEGVVWPSAGGRGREGAGKPGPGYLRKKKEGWPVQIDLQLPCNAYFFYIVHRVKNKENRIPWLSSG